MSQEFALYHSLLGDIKVRLRQAQNKAASSVNSELILLYWDIGRLIDIKQKQEGWGSGIIPRLAVDLKNELPEQKGFSERNIKRMLRFFREYRDLLFSYSSEVLDVAQGIQMSKSPIMPQLASQLNARPDPNGVLSIILKIPWFHHVILIEKVKDLPTRLWYIQQVLEQGWSRDTLSSQIKNRAHERQGAAVNNFDKALPATHALVAQGLLKDPYIFDFLTLESPFHERELETGLLTHVQKFLMELGRGFAFVGRQYPLTIDDQEFFMDLLFYHLKLRCFVVVDLKVGEFKPEYVGKINFYCSVVDDRIRNEHDAPTIGLILCQSKNRVVAEYSLRNVQKPIGIADYDLTRVLPRELSSSLPSIEALEAELSSDLEKREDE